MVDIKSPSDKVSAATLIRNSAVVCRIRFIYYVLVIRKVKAKITNSDQNYKSYKEYNIENGAYTDQRWDQVPIGRLSIPIDKSHPS